MPPMQDFGLEYLDTVKSMYLKKESGRKWRIGCEIQEKSEACSSWSKLTFTARADKKDGCKNLDDLGSGL